MAKYRYNVTFDLDEDGVIIVRCPALRACTTYGYTREEALCNIREAMALCVECLIDDGEPIPESESGPEAITFEV